MNADVWVGSLAAPAGPFAGWLSADERRRAVALRFARDRRRFVVGRGTLRAILGAYAGVGPAAVRLVYGRSGKPALAPGCGPDGLAFNVSHAGELLVVAVAEMAVGVDVEQIDPQLDWPSFAGAVLAPAEARALAALPAAERPAAFLRRWTRKEAYAKALGEGLVLPLESIEPDGPVGTTAEPAPAGGWWLRELELGRGGFVAALASAQPVRTVTYHDAPSAAPFHWRPTPKDSIPCSRFSI